MQMRTDAGTSFQAGRNPSRWIAARIAVPTGTVSARRSPSLPLVRWITSLRTHRDTASSERC